MRRNLLILLIFAYLVHPAVAQDLPSWCLSVWYPSGDPTGGDSLAANADLINVVNPFWYNPAADGTLQAATIAENADQLAAWRAAGMKIMPSIFSNISTVLDAPESQAAHIQAILNLVERMDYDGIDIDYESFAASTRDHFSTFIEALASALHQNGRRLSIAVHPKTDDAGTWVGAAAQDWTRLAPAVDVFTIMTYDYTNRNEPPGTIAPTPWVLDVLGYAESVTDLSKVRMGLPFYAYTWMRGNPPATPIAWTAVQRFINAFHPEVIRDPVDMEAHIDLHVTGLPRQVVYYADSTELQFKLNAVHRDFPTLGGAAIWGIGGEDPANWDVLREANLVDCQMPNP